MKDITLLMNELSAKSSGIDFYKMTDSEVAAALNERKQVGETVGKLDKRTALAILGAKAVEIADAAMDATKKGHASAALFDEWMTELDGFTLESGGTGLAVLALLVDDGFITEDDVAALLAEVTEPVLQSWCDTTYGPYPLTASDVKRARDAALSA